MISCSALSTWRTAVVTELPSRLVKLRRETPFLYTEQADVITFIVKKMLPMGQA